MLTIINEDFIRSSISMSEVVDTVESAYCDFFDGKILVPGRITMPIRGEEHSSIFIPANHLTKYYYGIKQASSFPDNHSKGLSTVFSDIHLYYSKTGEPLAVISANYLTALKTGAASAVATRYLARPGELVLALIGCGIQARTQLTGISVVRLLKEIRLYDIYQGNAEQLRDELESSGKKFVKVFDDANKCIDGADVICTTTTAREPVFDGRFLKNGSHVNAVGSVTPTMQEIDTETVQKADKVVVDQAHLAWEVAGDLLVPLSQGKINKNKIYGELPAIVNRSLAGRENDTENTIYESLGFAALDLAVAILVYEKALELKSGIKIIH